MHTPARTETSITCFAEGELLQRALANAERLERDVYEPRTMYERMAAKTEGWSGDTEGRLLLAQVLINRAVKREPRHLDELLSLWDSYCNEHGYFGPLHEFLNEQQLASHGWVLRALCELHAWRGCSWSRARIDMVVRNLVMQCLGEIERYPIDHRNGMKLGMHSGDVDKRRGRWLLSTDFGCIFIVLDGLVQAQELLQDPEVELLCTAMVERFLEVDIIGLGLQTHATLTALRGLLRYQSSRPQTRATLLPAVIERFDAYLQQGMSETWGNHNWFGDPRWTEPCAIVDALQLCRQLWQLTGDDRWRDILQLTRWNAFAHGQRSNGGFGPDTCVGSNCESGGSGAMLRPSVPEAFWCCSMRGAEGLADLIVHQACMRDGIVHLILAESCRIALPDGGCLHVHSAYPWRGNWQISSDRPLRLCLPAPVWCSDFQVDGQAKAPESGWLDVNISAGVSVQVSCRIQQVQQEHLGARNTEPGQVWRHGPVILARNGLDQQPLQEAPRQVDDKHWRSGDISLQPVSENWLRPMATWENRDDPRGSYADHCQQVLF